MKLPRKGRKGKQREGRGRLWIDTSGISTFMFQRKRSSWHRGLAREKRKNEETGAEARIKASVLNSDQSCQLLKIG